MGVTSFHHLLNDMVVLHFLQDRNQEFLHINNHLQELESRIQHGAQDHREPTQDRGLWQAPANLTRAKVLPTMAKPNKDPLEEVHKDMVQTHQDTLDPTFSQIQSTKIRTIWLTINF